MQSNDKNELINVQLEKEITGLVLQGYSLFKKYFRTKRESQETCKKCGSNAIITSYCNKDHARDDRFSASLQHGTEEKLHKICDICRYSWLQEVLQTNQE